MNTGKETLDGLSSEYLPIFVPSGRVALCSQNMLASRSHQPWNFQADGSAAGERPTRTAAQFQTETFPPARAPSVNDHEISTSRKLYTSVYPQYDDVKGEFPCPTCEQSDGIAGKWPLKWKRHAVDSICATKKMEIGRDLFAVSFSFFFSSRSFFLVLILRSNVAIEYGSYNAPREGSFLISFKNCALCHLHYSHHITVVSAFVATFKLFPCKEYLLSFSFLSYKL